MIINNLFELENLIKLMKTYEIPLLKLDGLEINLNKNSNTTALKEESKKPLAVFDDPDFYAGIPFHTKMKEND